MKGLFNFLWDFFVGDDPAIAAGVVLTLGATALVATTSVPAWWIVPVAVAALLAASLWRASRSG
jgi:hypothetical protein